MTSSDSYSPDRRTALILTGTGADGVYHAGVLRALHEAGIKIDLVGGRGIGAVGAVLTAAQERYGAAFAHVLPTCRVWVNGEPATDGTVVGNSDEVAVLPPVSGGAA